MEFTKMEGAGNDFILIDAGNGMQDLPALARRICHRHFGIGADGVLLLLPSERADLHGDPQQRRQQAQCAAMASAASLYTHMKRKYRRQ